MQETEIRIECTDRQVLAASLFEAGPAPGPVLVVAPALGVPRRFYGAFARFMAAQGMAVLTFDYRGSGGSAEGPVRGCDMRMQDWGERDLEAVLGWALHRYPGRRLCLVGHSAGGQLPGLAPLSERLDAMVLVAASAPHLRHYPLRSWPLLGLTWYLLGPLLSLGRDDFPTRRTGLGSTRVAAGVVAQWARWARSHDYLFDAAHALDTGRYARLALPVLSFCFEDDGYATPAAVDALLCHYPAARIARRVLPRAASGVIGHFGYFRERCRDTLWRETADWLLSAGESREAAHA
jgi:predicted alpha/beta hydrolase